MSLDGTRKELVCACGHRGVLYPTGAYAAYLPGLRVGGFINRNREGFDLSGLYCGICRRQGLVTAASPPVDRADRFTVSIGLTVEKRASAQALTPL